MNDSNGYAVFFFPQALEALGDAIKPYLQEGTAGTHVLCRGIDTGGALIEMLLQGAAADGSPVELELMVPSAMVRMIVSAHSDATFGFASYALREAAARQVAATPDPREGELAPAPAAAAASAKSVAASAEVSDQSVSKP